MCNVKGFTCCKIPTTAVSFSYMEHSSTFQLTVLVLRIDSLLRLSSLGLYILQKKYNTSTPELKPIQYFI